jgi:hypothetical protein
MLCIGLDAVSVIFKPATYCHRETRLGIGFEWEIPVQALPSSQEPEQRMG